MTTKLKSAEEAYIGTVNKIESGTTNELREVAKKIDEAILNGKFFFSSQGVLSNSTKIRLTALGYKVEVGCQHNECYYSVSWNAME